MNTSAIVMMVVAMLIIWGGLAAAIINLWLSIRVGQGKVPFTRQWITPSPRLVFLERRFGCL